LPGPVYNTLLPKVWLYNQHAKGSNSRAFLASSASHPLMGNGASAPAGPAPGPAAVFVSPRLTQHGTQLIVHPSNAPLLGAGQLNIQQWAQQASPQQAQRGPIPAAPAPAQLPAQTSQQTQQNGAGTFASPDKSSCKSCCCSSDVQTCHCFPFHRCAHLLTCASVPASRPEAGN
jgi:hypothetical protein